MTDNIEPDFLSRPRLFSQSLQGVEQVACPINQFIKE